MTRPATCPEASPCWEGSHSPADLCERHLAQFRAWREAKNAQQASSDSTDNAHTDGAT